MWLGVGCLVCLLAIVYADLLCHQLLLALLQVFIILIDNKRYAQFTYRTMFQLEML